MLFRSHQHAWDFRDAPLVYKAFLGNQLKQDGVQLKWLAPTDLFMEVGAELAGGDRFPGGGNNKNGVGGRSLFGHLGGDIGESTAWKLGLARLTTRPEARSYDDADSTGTTVSNAFSGRSSLWSLGGVLKWAPAGNSTVTNFKLQGEYFRRRQNGALTFDSAGATGATATDSYDTSQSGWYLQGVYQFMPRWRAGLRHDRLSSGGVNLGAGLLANVATFDYKPTRNAAMLDWSPSEFSRLRLQFGRDQSLQGVTDRQVFLQYIYSLGAHGAHKF